MLYLEEAGEQTQWGVRVTPIDTTLDPYYIGYHTKEAALECIVLTSNQRPKYKPKCELVHRVITTGPWLGEVSDAD